MAPMLLLGGKRSVLKARQSSAVRVAKCRKGDLMPAHSPPKSLIRALTNILSGRVTASGRNGSEGETMAVN